jgi:hypothetical protein
MYLSSGNICDSPFSSEENVQTLDLLKSSLLLGLQNEGDWVAYVYVLVVQGRINNFSLKFTGKNNLVELEGKGLSSTINPTDFSTPKSAGMSLCQAQSCIPRAAVNCVLCGGDKLRLLLSFILAVDDLVQPFTGLQLSSVITVLVSAIAVSYPR